MVSDCKHVICGPLTTELNTAITCIFNTGSFDGEIGGKQIYPFHASNP